MHILSLLIYGQCRLRNMLSIIGDFKQIIRRAAKQLAHCLYIFILNGFCFVIYHFIKILIAHIKLLIEPIFGFALLFKQFKRIKPNHYITPALSNVIIR